MERELLLVLLRLTNTFSLTAGVNDDFLHA